MCYTLKRWNKSSRNCPVWIKSGKERWVATINQTSSPTRVIFFCSIARDHLTCEGSGTSLISSRSHVATGSLFEESCPVQIGPVDSANMPEQLAFDQSRTQCRQKHGKNVCSLRRL